MNVLHFSIIQQNKDTVKVTFQALNDAFNWKNINHDKLS